MTATAAVGLAGTAVAICRPGEAWLDGPAVPPRERKNASSYAVPLADFLAWVRVVEGAAPTRDDYARHCRRLRRLYYSEFTGGAGRLFDTLFGTGDLGAPITVSATLPAAVLDRLFSTDYVMTGSPSLPFTTAAATPIDMSHVFVMLDQGVNGLPFYSRYLEWRLSAPVAGITTWVGDLASWFVEWNSERIKAAGGGTIWDPAEQERQRQALRARKVALEDVLGNMDGQILAVTARNPAVVSIAALLRAYYLDPPAAGTPHVTTRFADFVRRAVPAIPHTDTGGAVTLAPGAADAIAGQMATVATLFLTHARAPQSLSRQDIDRLASVFADVATFRPIIDAIAADFVQFLAAGLSGGNPSWPSEYLEPLTTDYGGYYLRPCDDDATYKYGGQVRSGYTAATAPKFVEKLQAALRQVGVTCLEVNGRFDGDTQYALRHFQAYASLDSTAGVVAAGARVGDRLEHFFAPRHYRGPIHGLFTPETARTLRTWLGGITVVEKDPNTGERRERKLCDRLHCPVVVEAWNVDTNDVPKTIIHDQVWRLADCAQSNAAMFARDLSRRYTIPPARLVAPAGGVAIGAYTSSYDGGPIIQLPWNQGTTHYPGAIWKPDMKVTPAALIGRDIDPAQDATLASTYRPIAAVAFVECVSYFDSMNGYDSARVSIGLFHWALCPQTKTGEMFALLAYFKHQYPDAYQRYFGVYGVQPHHAWPAADPNPMWVSKERKYVNAPALYGMADSGGTLHPDDPQPVSAGADYDHFRDWHWWYRFAMACRDSHDLWRSMWDFARLRLRDLHATPWAATVAAGVPTAAGGSRPATFGEVFTSEFAMALVLRYHVNYPAPIVSNGHAGSRIRAALAASGIANMDTAAWGDAQQQALITTLKNNPPAPTADVGTKFDTWTDGTLGATNGRLRTTAGSFTLDAAGLPALPGGAAATPEDPGGVIGPAPPPEEM